LDRTTTWLSIVALFLCGVNVGAVLHARFCIPRRVAFWPSVLVVLPVATMMAAQLGAVPAYARVWIALIGLISMVGAAVVWCIPGSRDRSPRNGV
jgi:hypothetical protein